MWESMHGAYLHFFRFAPVRRNCSECSAVSFLLGARKESGEGIPILNTADGPRFKGNRVPERYPWRLGELRGRFAGAVLERRATNAVA